MDLPIAILIVLGAAATGFMAVALVRRVGSVLSNPTRGTPRRSWWGLRVACNQQGEPI